MSEHEFSRVIEVTRVPAGGRAFEIVASAAERKALAARLRVEAIEDLRAHGRIGWLPGGQILEVEAQVEARVTQCCVVSLEPFDQTLVFSFTRRFTLEGQPQTGEVVIDVERDEPEPLEGADLDLGEIVAEELALSLDPYPRGPLADAVMRAWATSDGAAPPRAEEGAAVTFNRH